MRPLVFHLLPLAGPRLDRVTNAAIRRFGVAPPGVVTACPACALLYVALAHTEDEDRLAAMAAEGARRLAHECPDHARRIRVAHVAEIAPAPAISSPLPGA
jgi:hypothetical protein